MSASRQLAAGASVTGMHTRLTEVGLSAGADRSHKSMEVAEGHGHAPTPNSWLLATEPRTEALDAGTASSVNSLVARTHPSVAHRGAEPFPQPRPASPMARHRALSPPSGARIRNGRGGALKHRPDRTYTLRPGATRRLIEQRAANLVRYVAQ